MRLKVIGIVGALAVFGIGLAFVLVGPNRGTGPWRPATATLGPCNVLVIEHQEDEGIAGRWTSEPNRLIPDELNRPGALKGEFRTRRSGSPPRGEFRSAGIVVELTSGVAVDC